MVRKVKLLTCSCQQQLRGYGKRDVFSLTEWSWIGDSVLARCSEFEGWSCVLARCPSSLSSGPLSVLWCRYDKPIRGCCFAAPELGWVAAVQILEARRTSGPADVTWTARDRSGVTSGSALTSDWLSCSSKLTSPRWKNFKGLRLQWKDKIRLNNLIWRCWHMQCQYISRSPHWISPGWIVSFFLHLSFPVIERRNTALCQFASPLDCDQHNKPEAVVLEGKYWKRRLATVTAEYKKWRIFFKNRIMGRASKDLNDVVSCHRVWAAFCFLFVSFSQRKC